MHDHQPRAAFRRRRRHVRVAAQAGNVIDERRAQRRGAAGDGRLAGVDRQGQPHFEQWRDNGFEPRPFLCFSDRAEARPRGFRADVDDVGAGLDHCAGLRQRRIDGVETPAVGEEIRRDVQNAHDQRF